MGKALTFCYFAGDLPMATHSVRRGDTLSALARKYNTSVSALAQANNIKNVNQIRTGQRLTIPDSK